jgi:hypothetical protein
MTGAASSDPPIAWTRLRILGAGSHVACSTPAQQILRAKEMEVFPLRIQPIFRPAPVRQRMNSSRLSYSRRNKDQPFPLISVERCATGRAIEIGQDSPHSKRAFVSSRFTDSTSPSTLPSLRRPTGTRLFFPRMTGSARCSIALRRWFNWVRNGLCPLCLSASSGVCHISIDRSLFVPSLSPMMAAGGQR